MQGNWFIVDFVANQMTLWIKWCLMLCLANHSLAQLWESSKRWWRTRERWPDMESNTHQKELKSGCALKNHLTLEQMSNYEFHCTWDKRDILAGMLFSQKGEGNLLQVDTSSQIFRKLRVCETIRFFRLNIVEHARCRSSHLLRFWFMCGKRSDERARNKVHQKMEWLSRAIQGICKGNLMERRIQFMSHVFLGKKKNEFVREIDEWIRQGPGEDGQLFTPETCRLWVLFMGMQNEIPISSKEPKSGKALFLQDAEQMQLSSGGSSPDTSCALV